jgi:hypothetical protein
MGLMTTYVCDCCGGQSPDLTKFSGVPASFAVQSWQGEIENALLCLTCLSVLVSAINNAAATLKNSKQATQL